MSAGCKLKNSSHNLPNKPAKPNQPISTTRTSLFLLQGQADGVETLGFINTLQKVEIPLVSNCTKTFRFLTVKPEHQICAGEKGADSCGGDSGGPLVAR